MPSSAAITARDPAVGVVLCHSTSPGKDMVFLPHALLGPRDRGMMITGEGLYPVLSRRCAELKIFSLTT
jgi:hypothetical protein